MNDLGSLTEELRARLGELGVRYTTDDSNDYEITEWQGPYNLWWQFVYDPYEEEPYGELRLLEAGGSTHLTPEQAVAATVGARTLTAEQVRECAKGVYFEGYSDGATHRVNGIEETDWQAIADKLNATLGAETCHFKVVIDQDPSRRGRENICECDKCGYRCARGFIEDERFKHCPNCGKRIVKEEAE